MYTTSPLPFSIYLQWQQLLLAYDCVPSRVLVQGTGGPQVVPCARVQRSEAGRNEGYPLSQCTGTLLCQRHRTQQCSEAARYRSSSVYNYHPTCSSEDRRREQVGLEELKDDWHHLLLTGHIHCHTTALATCTATT